MRTELFYQRALHGRAFGPGLNASATVVGEEIVEPWKKGRQLVFILSDMSGNDAPLYILNVSVQGKRRDTGAWETMNTREGTAMTLPNALTRGFGTAIPEEDRTVTATLDMSKVDGMTYESVRLSITETAGIAAEFIALYAIVDLQGDQLVAKDQQREVLDGITRVHFQDRDVSV